ncbi:L-rhamnose mutarotase [Niabella hirudinis]|uniref:L-rhamnose mutarotase n=1 Tax=Niabella hirudinis TaxID=1285929 RepID=UPI003EC140C4
MRNRKNPGWSQKTFEQPVKRYCQTLDLKDDRRLIEEYIKMHSELYHWPEVREGLKSIGILEMEIYCLGTRLFMIVETPLDFEWEDAFKRLASLPRQAEWELYMSTFQIADPVVVSEGKWQLMDRIFYLYD